jgi:hydrogenase expression/formation protein HypD
MLGSGFGDPKLVADLAAKIASLGVTNAQLMEVCGTHTVSLAKHGVKALLPGGVRIVSGPGCPVCVTSDSDLSQALQVAKTEGVTLATFGDMMRVPVDGVSLLKLKARGCDVRTIYSPFDIFALPSDKEVVFFGVGFETTSPGVAAVLREAQRRGVKNLSIISCFKLIPPALRALLEGGDARIDGLILPGHVSTIIGTRAYDFLVKEFNVPCVIAGFEPIDLMLSVYSLLKMIKTKKPMLVNTYTRSVRAEGNPDAVRIISEYFEPVGSEWRGLGTIPRSGLALRDEHSNLDARLKFDLRPTTVPEPVGCMCPEVLRGVALPTDCPLFSKECTPENPVGPCMVSSEGACAAYHNYG